MSKPPIIKGALAFGIVAALAFLALRYLPLADWIEAFANWISEHGPAGYFLYSGGYILGTMLCSSDGRARRWILSERPLLAYSVDKLADHRVSLDLGGHRTIAEVAIVDPARS